MALQACRGWNGGSRELGVVGVVAQSDASDESENLVAAVLVVVGRSDDVSAVGSSMMSKQVWTGYSDLATIKNRLL